MNARLSADYLASAISSAECGRTTKPDAESSRRISVGDYRRSSAVRADDAKTSRPTSGKNRGTAELIINALETFDDDDVVASSEDQLISGCCSPRCNKPAISDGVVRAILYLPTTRFPIRRGYSMPRTGRMPRLEARSERAPEKCKNTKVEGMRYEARRRGRSSPDSLAF